MPEAGKGKECQELWADLVHIPLHAPEVRPEVDKGEDDADAALACLRQHEIQPLQRQLIVNADLHASAAFTRLRQMSQGAHPRHCEMHSW